MNRQNAKAPNGEPNKEFDPLVRPAIATAIDKALGPRCFDTAYEGALVVEFSRRWIQFGIDLLAIWRFGGRMFGKAKFSPAYGTE